MKVLGWCLLFLSALSMAMCSNLGPETREFVMSPAGSWTWVLWFGAVFGGAALIARGNSPGRPFGQGLRWIGVVALCAFGIVVAALVVPTLDHSDPPVAPASTEREPRQQCIADRERLAAFNEEVSGCVQRLSGESRASDDRPRNRSILNPISNQMQAVSEEEYRLLSVPGRTADEACYGPEFRAQLTKHQDVCGQVLEE